MHNDDVYLTGMYMHKTGTRLSEWLNSMTRSLLTMCSLVKPDARLKLRTIRSLSRFYSERSDQNWLSSSTR